MKTDYKKISKKVQNRLKNEVYQKGGDVAGLRENRFSDSGNFVNMINQLSYMVVNGVASIVDGVSAVESVLTLPSDLSSITDKPNEPLPSNTPISRVINII